MAEYLSELEQILKKDEFKEIINNSNIDIKTKCEKIFDLVNEQVKEATSNAAKKLIKKNKRKTGKAKEWWCWELQVLNDRKKFFRQRVRINSAQIYKKLLIVTRRHFKKMIKIKKNEIKKKKIEALSEKFKKNRNFFWQDLNKLRENKLSMNIGQDELLLHYKNLFNSTHKTSNCLKKNRKK